MSHGTRVSTPHEKASAYKGPRFPGAFARKIQSFCMIFHRNQATRAFEIDVEPKSDERGLGTFAPNLVPEGIRQIGVQKPTW